jgi:hypothetical protein
MGTRVIASRLCAQLLLASCVVLAGTLAARATPCVIPPATAQAIADFKSNPQALVAPSADTRTIEAMVTDLVGTDPTLAADVVHLAADTNARFRTAIAAGLAQAAVACSNIDQHAALTIQQAVAGFEDGDFQASFAAVAGDLSTAAAEAAAASAEASVGSVIILNRNTSAAAATNPGGGGGPTLVQITATTATTSATTPTTPTTSTTAASPVSATR